MFWVAKNLGVLDTIHEPLFNAIHRGQRLQRVDDVVAFFEQYGADPGGSEVAELEDLQRKVRCAFLTRESGPMGFRVSQQSLWMGDLSQVCLRPK